MAAELDIRSCKFDIQASVFGIYNRFLYYVDFEGNVGMNRLRFPLDSFFSSKKESGKPLSSLPAKEKFKVVTSLKDFPVDSIVYGKKLIVATSDAVYIIPFSGVPDDSKGVGCLSISNVISLAKSGRFLFLSRDEEGLMIKCLDEIMYNIHDIPSSGVTISGKTILNLHPDHSPTIFRHIYNREEPYEDILIECGRSGMIVENTMANDKLKESKLTGRGIVFPFVSDKEVLLYGYNRSEYQVDIKPLAKLNENNREKPIEYELIDIAACKITEQDNPVRIPKKWELNYKRKDLLNNFFNEETREYPLEILEHEEGYVVQYWDHVDFIAFGGKRYTLVDETEISRVMVFPSYSVYSSYLTIASETNCWIFRIRSCLN